MDEAALKNFPSSRSKGKSGKNRPNHGIWQDNTAIRRVLAIGFTSLCLAIVGNILIGFVGWERWSVRSDGTRLTEAASTGKTSRNPIKVVDVARRPDTDKNHVGHKVEPHLRVFGAEREKQSAIKPTDVGITVESAIRDIGLSCSKSNVQCKTRTSGEPPGPQCSQAGADDHVLTSLHRLLVEVDEYESKSSLFPELVRKAFASTLESRLGNHVRSTPMTTRGIVGSRYDAGFQLSIRLPRGFEAWLYAFDTSIYGVCPRPSSVEHLFQYDYDSRGEDARLWKRQLSGNVRYYPFAKRLTFWSFLNANTPLLGPVCWTRTSFLSALQSESLTRCLSPLERLDWSCFNRAITTLPFDKFCEQVIRPRISRTQISGAIFFLISLCNLMFDLHDWRRCLLRSTPTSSMRTVWSKFRHSLEPSLQNGNMRVRWTCKCGQPLYDDFQEIRPGAAAQLEYELNRRYNILGNNSRNGGKGSHGSSGRDCQRLPASSNVKSWCSPSMWGSTQSSSLPFHEPQSLPGDDMKTAITQPQSESTFLLLCIPHLRWASKLVHMDVHTLQSDQSFFQELGSHYCSMRGLWTSWFSLKQLTRIQFVQFELHKNELVDIRRLNDLPPETRDDYRYRPVPPELIPPIGENLLMHLYDHPEDADDDGFCLDRVPKKLRERLTCSQRIGWGVNFSEGLNVKKVCVLGLIGLFTSTAFGMAWSIKRNDVQGGFGVAAFVLMALTFVTGILQAALDTK